MNTRFADVAAQPLYAVATLVDPRYRGKLFSQSEFATAKQWLVDPITEGATTVSDDDHGVSELK